MSSTCLKQCTWIALGLGFAVGCAPDTDVESQHPEESPTVLTAESAAPEADTPGTAGAAESVTRRAYRALGRGSVADVRRAIAELDEATEADPEDGYALFYSGALRIMLVSQRSSLRDLLAIPSLIPEVLSRLERAHKLLPNDFRVTSFLSMSETMAGVLLGDTATLESGLAHFETGIAQHAPYGHFLRAMALGGVAADDPKYLLAMDDMLAVANGCAYLDGDATTRYRYPSDPTESIAPTVCLNEGIVPHVWEGVFLSYGDMALKAGWDVEDARALYRSAQTAPHYDTWPFADVLRARIEDAADRAERLHDLNPFNDPEPWAEQICAGCHQLGEAER